MSTTRTKRTETPHPLSPPNAGEKGFTLLDITIILLVIGFLAAPLIQEYRTWNQGQKIGGTQAKIDNIEEALETFFFDNGYYPCPTDQTLAPNAVVLPPGAPQFGDENRLPPVLPATVGNCILPAGPPPTFLTGAVPFKNLKLTNDDALDNWEHKITYVVTLALTHPVTYSGAAGALTVNAPQTLQATAAGDDTCQGSPVPTVNSTHLVLFSHGASAVGAYTNEGIQSQACGAANTDSENCDNDAVFQFPECSNNAIAGATFYDDLMSNSYTGWQDTPTTMWELANDPNDLGSKAGYIGLGNPDPQHTLDVLGNIKATNTDPLNDATDNKRGNALASDFCDSNGNNCFDPNSIAGDDPNMNCTSATSAVSSIGGNKASCIDTIPTPTPTTCPLGEFIINITAAGVITCG